MQASMEHALRVCDGDTLHVDVIDGATELDTDAEVSRRELVHRRNALKDRVNDIKKALGVKTKVVYHEYATLDEAIARTGEYEFDVLFCAAKDQMHCGPFPDNIGIMQTARAAAGYPPAQVDIVPTVYEPGTEFVCSSTKVRKRAKKFKGEER
jgi:hypothetical protein